MLVSNAADLAKEVRKVFGLCKAGELRGVVKSNVYDLGHSGLRQPVEERCCRRFGKANRGDRYRVSHFSGRHDGRRPFARVVRKGDLAAPCQVCIVDLL